MIARRILLMIGCLSSACDTSGSMLKKTVTGTPALTAGVWTNLTPAGTNLFGHYGIDFVAMDPSVPTTLYFCQDVNGLWKSSDGGSTWKQLGDPAAIGDTTTGYLDSPIRVAVDPHDSMHLYATQGVRGSTLGFWISTDGGETWAQPQGFLDAATNTIGHRDVTSMVVDPTDFKHVLIGCHNPWMGMQNAGVLESKDGGATFTAHAPVASWTAGSMGINFLFQPDQEIGNSQTWLVADQSAGFWRTTDSGDHWTQVSTNTITHGGNDIYYAKNGTLYAGAALYPMRSTDNGVTWEQLKNGPPYSYYYTVIGDGNNLYTQISFTGANNGNTDGSGVTPAPYLTSPESDGETWVPYMSGMQTFIDGPFVMIFDSVNRIIYSANWDAGLWALKVSP